MKGLVINDLHVIRSMGRKFLFFVLAFIYMFNEDLRVFGLSLMPFLCAIMLCRIQILQLSKGQKQFFFTLPFSRSQYLVEKYLLCLIFPLLVFVVYAAIMLVFGLVDLTDVGSSFLTTLLMLFVYLASMIPVIVRFKENSTVVLLMISVGFAAVLASGFIDESVTIWLISHLNMLRWIAIPVGLVLLGLSYLLSRHLLEKEEF